MPQSSRLRRLFDLYHSGQGTIAPDHPDYDIAVEGERDMQLLGFAFDQLATTPASDEYRKLLKKLVMDSALPQHDRTESPGRDAGFEIYVGAVCTGAQLLPVTWEEPDVTCVLDNTKYGIAAKRIKNVKNLRARVKKAVEQIHRSKLPGMIVLDVGLAFNPSNSRIRQLHETVFLAEYESNFHATWSRYQPKVQELMGRSNVLGIVVHDYHIRERPEGWQLAGITIRVPAEARGTEDRRIFERLSALYTFGLPNQSDASDRPIILP